MKSVYKRVGRVKFAVVASLVALLSVGGAAFAMNQGSSDNPVPASEDIVLAVDESPSPEEARKISLFSILEGPTEENLAELSDDQRNLIKRGLKIAGGKQPSALSSLGRVQTDLGSTVLAYTASDKLCLVSTKSTGQNLGTCMPIDWAIKHGAYLTGVNDSAGDFYLAGLVPDGVYSIDTGEGKTSEIQLYGNVYEAIVPPENLEIVGRSNSGEVVTKESIPIEMFAGK